MARELISTVLVAMKIIHNNDNSSIVVIREPLLLCQSLTMTAVTRYCCEYCSNSSVNTRIQRLWLLPKLDWYSGYTLQVRCCWDAVNAREEKIQPSK